MSTRAPGQFKITPVTVTTDGYEYPTFRVSGWLNGQRIRKNFKSRAEAQGEKQRLEVAAANAEGDIQAVNTRLTSSQVAQAESAFARLGDHSMPLAVEWFLANYRPPTLEKTLETAVVDFLAARETEVSAPVYADYRKLLRALLKAFPLRDCHTLSTGDLEAFLPLRGPAKKTWNNGRTYLHSFFEFCRDDRRRWVTTNPAKALKQHSIPRGIPHTESAAVLAEMFSFLEQYSGPARCKYAPGYLVPYFALATFAGLRPSARDGELFKIASLKDKSRIIDLGLGVIRITPEIAKTSDLRQVTIQPNLAAWLARYPLDKFPLMVPSMAEHIAPVRQRFKLVNDGLRHTFVSAHVAKFKSIGGTALEAGNSERIIRKHYLNSMTEAEAGAFWGIVPKA